MEPKAATLARGTRDFGPAQMRRRHYVFGIITEAFRRYGYGPLETPAMEQLVTLTGKYGDEGDKLIFHVLNSGNFAEGIEEGVWMHQRSNPKGLVPLIAEKALRYDLTVPLARFVAMNHSKIAWPFKRYQIQPVWRADRPQKGRFREFVQCDADIVGHEISTFHRAELLRIYQEVLEALGFHSFAVKVNDRRLLALLAAYGGISGRWAELGILLDKLDKQGWDKVGPELVLLGMRSDAVEHLQSALPASSRDGSVMSWETYLNTVSRWMQDPNCIGDAGLREQTELALDETQRMVEAYERLGTSPSKLTFDPCLARGIDYYTGPVVEVVSPALGLGSLGGGGYYSGLTAMFGYPDWKGMGISFGAERILEGMEQLGLFREEVGRGLDILCYATSPDMELVAQQWTARWRGLGLAADWYSGTGKFKKAYQYAQLTETVAMVILGDREWAQGEVMVQWIQGDRSMKVQPEQIDAAFLRSALKQA
ncbi:MAG: histidine--tRNA ligase [Sphingomonadales bacterium]|nr:histidine--tRNA ligase [Sphingomonadales bacterium]